MLHQGGLLLLLLVSFAAGRGPFSGHKVIRITPATELELETTKALLQDTETIDIWRYPSAVNAPIDIRLSPLVYDEFTKELHNFGMGTTVLIEDVQMLVDEQNAGRNTLKYKLEHEQFDYSKYHKLEEINTWMENKTKTYPELVSIFHVAKTYEGRSMNGIKISTKSSFSKKLAFWIQGGIHAREWIAPATVVYMAGKLIDEFNSNPELTDLVRKFDWYILPVANPDGYAFTWESNRNRLWRKTRSINRNSRCVGVDPNRNWDIAWCKKGASRNPCSDVYCGPRAFSEPEVRGAAKYIWKIKKNLAGFIDFHSYSQLWLSPWAYTNKLPKDYKEQDNGSRIAVNALQKMFGTEYIYGNIAGVLYIASGGSEDWVYGKANVTFSYCAELRDYGYYGFLLPESQIIDTGKETLAGLTALAQFVHTKESSKKTSV